MKRTLAFLTAFVLIAATAFSAVAAKASDIFGQVNVNLPKITVELRGTDFDTDNTGKVSASLGGEALKVDDFHIYNQEKDSTLVYMLVDVSATINDTVYINNLKDFIRTFASNMRGEDAMALWTFGSNVKRVLEPTKDAETVGEAADHLTFSDGETHLYDALSQVYNEATNRVTDYTRIYAIVFSDCMDDTDNGLTQDEVKSKYSTHLLPLFVAAPPNSDRASTDLIGPIARSSGGDLKKPESRDEFLELGDSIDNVSILTLSSNNNIATGEDKNLQITVDNNTYDISVSVSRSVADTEPPVIKNLTYDEQNNRFVMTFSEKVTDASQKGAYSVSDETGKKWSVADVEATAVADSVQLVMAERITDGLYTVIVEGLTDTSQQKNPLAEKSVSVEVTGIVLPEETQDNGTADMMPLLLVIAAGVIIISGAIVLFVVLLSRKNGGREENPVIPAAPVMQPPQQNVVNEYAGGGMNVKHHIKNNETVKLRLSVKTGKNSEQVINTEVADSIIVGRSSICEIFIDDAKLSRQHFAIETMNQELYISDLNSKNGTFVNGVRLNGRRKLVNHDRITAGLSEIAVTITE